MMALLNSMRSATEFIGVLCDSQVPLKHGSPSTRTLYLTSPTLKSGLIRGPWPSWP